MRGRSLLADGLTGGSRSDQHQFRIQRDLVAQICNLPYRRLVIGRASESSSVIALADPSSGGPAEGPAAECNSAIQQITNLRYAKHILRLLVRRFGYRLFRQFDGPL